MQRTNAGPCPALLLHPVAARLSGNLPASLPADLLTKVHAPLHTDTLLRVLTKVRLEEEKDKAKQLPTTPPQASWSNTHESANRHAAPLVAGLLFSKTLPGTPLSSFSWPLNTNGVEDEGAGYEIARQWLQENVCPPHVQAVLVDSDSWPQW